MRRLALGQRVHVRRDWLERPVGVAGAVVRLRRSDHSAWIALDERVAVCPFPAGDERASHVRAWPEDCGPAPLEPRDEPVWLAVLAAADARRRVDYARRGEVAAVLLEQGLALDVRDAADAVDRIAATGRVELDARGLRVCPELVVIR